MRKSPGNWVWLLAAAAVVVVVGAALYAFSVLSSPTVVPLPEATTAGTNPAAPATPSTPETEPGEPVGGAEPKAVPHGGDGAFLNPAYADGARELQVPGDRYYSVVGATTDADIVAVNIDYEVRGIDTDTTDVVWTYPSYSCSEGTWDGIALCADTADSVTAFGGKIPDVVGLDLASGEPTFRFTPPGVPGQMSFIGADDTHGYFVVSMHKMEGAGIFGNHHVVALTNDGTVAWMTALEHDEFMAAAALVANDRIAVSLNHIVMQLDRATGSIVFDEAVTGEELASVDLLWDGWVTYERESEKSYTLSDQSGAAVAEYDFIDDFLPGSRGVTGPSMPMFEADALNGGDSGAGRTPWAVTSEGAKVFGSDIYGVVDARRITLVDGEQLQGASADGAVLLSSENQGTIHDGTTGEVLGGFSEPYSPVEGAIVDGIVFHDRISGENQGLILLLPGPA